MAQPTRDRYFDLLRVLAIVRVSVFHMFPFVVLELAFPSMGVMFALAGSLMANSLTRQPNPLKVLYGRVRRLLPALWVLAAVVVPAMFLVGWEQKPPLWHLITWLIPFADPPSSTFGVQAAEVLWYLVTYLWLVLLSPVMLWLYRRARLVTALLPIAAMAVLTVWPVWPADAIEEVGTDLLVFAACWIIGFAHRDGTLRRIPAAVVIPLAAACVGGSLYWSHTHPDAGGLKYIPVAYAVYNIGFVLFLLRWSPAMGWLSRRPGLTKWVSLINARAVTIYLWNNVAIALCYPVGDALQVWRLGKFFEVGYVLIALGLLCNAVLIFGWVEDVAARRKPRFLPWPTGEARTDGRIPPATPAAAPAIPVSPAPAAAAMTDTAELVGAGVAAPSARAAHAEGALGVSASVSAGVGARVGAVAGGRPRPTIAGGRPVPGDPADRVPAQRGPGFPGAAGGLSGRASSVTGGPVGPPPAAGAGPGGPGARPSGPAGPPPAPGARPSGPGGTVAGGPPGRGEVPGGPLGPGVAGVAGSSGRMPLSAGRPTASAGRASAANGGRGAVPAGGDGRAAAAAGQGRYHGRAAMQDRKAEPGTGLGPGAGPRHNERGSTGRATSPLPAPGGPAARPGTAAWPVRDGMPSGHRGPGGTVAGDPPGRAGNPREEPRRQPGAGRDSGRNHPGDAADQVRAAQNGHPRATHRPQPPEPGR